MSAAICRVVVKALGGTAGIIFSALLAMSIHSYFQFTNRTISMIIFPLLAILLLLCRRKILGALASKFGGQVFRSMFFNLLLVSSAITFALFSLMELRVLLFPFPVM
jgi:hypothetical protein